MTEEAKAPERGRMAFSKHLVELRRRLLYSVVALLVGFLACFNYSEKIFYILKLPMNSTVQYNMEYPFISFIPSTEKVSNLIFLGPAEAFWAHMKISLIAALVIMSPIIFYQVWSFISPGLQKHEKRLAIPFVFVTSGLFILGTLFCFVIVLPFAMNFLLHFKAGSLTPMISVEKYVDFCLKFILAFGVVFELPVVLVFLTRTGIVSIETLAKNRKYSVLMAFVAAALLTPTPDAFNQTLMAVPIIVLYEAGLIAARIFAKRRKKSSGPEEDKEVLKEDKKEALEDKKEGLEKVPEKAIEEDKKESLEKGLDEGLDEVLEKVLEEDKKEAVEEDKPQEDNKGGTSGGHEG